jgi:hypothetical protein
MRSAYPASHWVFVEVTEQLHQLGHSRKHGGKNFDQDGAGMRSHREFGATSSMLVPSATVISSTGKFAEATRFSVPV